MKRRDFLKFVGMASSASILASCGVEKSSEKIIPYLVPPDVEDYIPGEAMYRNTVCTECSAGCGATAKIIEWNPIKLDGQAGHPLNDGALCMRGQASLVRLYHPNRLSNPRIRKGGALEDVSWDEAIKFVRDGLSKANSSGKKSVYLAGQTTGSLSTLLDSFASQSGVERLPAYEAFSHANLRRANSILFNINDIPGYKIDESDYLLSVGADLIETFLNPVSNSQQIYKARKGGHFTWVHVEPAISLTGYKADERKTVKPGGESSLLLFLLNYMVSNGLGKNALSSNLRDGLPSISMGQAASATGLSEDDLNHMAQAFAQAKHPLLIVGGSATSQDGGLSTAVLAGMIQWVSGMIGTTVDFNNAEGMNNVGSLLDIKNLADRLNGNQIGVAFIARTNPLATVPASMKLAESLGNAAMRVVMTDFDSELTEMADVILPLSNGMESWGDVAASTAVTSVMKPVVSKLYDTLSEGDILMKLMGQAEDYGTWLQSQWKDVLGVSDVDALIKKGYADTGYSAGNITMNANAAQSFVSGNKLTGAAAAGGVLYAVPSIRAFDGRSTDIPLTTEIPDPLSTVSYGNYVSVSEAANVGEVNPILKDYPVVSVEGKGASMELPAFVQPHMPENVATIQFHQLDKSMLTMDSNTGELITRVDGASVNATGRTTKLSALAGGFDQQHRQLIPKPGDHHHEGEFEIGQTLYPEIKYETYRWGMHIDLESCTGCEACVAACYIENNIPVTGEDQHLMGREMSWIRIQPYYNEDGTMDSLVMMCQQCGTAPCENVCPVYATYHNDEGLNVMVYNRCVGTRYCHNNCPYKVRRFNYFDWTDEGAWAEPMTRMLNPDVYVRPKGVMEKCTFCLHRIRSGKDFAKDENRDVRDGEIQVACQQACPTNAITFGNLKDKNSEVYKKSQMDKNFKVLELLGTNPAITYSTKANKEEHA